MPLPYFPTLSTRGALLWSAATLALYLTMVLGPLAHLAEIAGGAVFDMRPTGYDLADANEILTALGTEGRRLYQRVQIPLDTLYPAMLAMMISCWLGWSVTRGAPRWLGTVGLAAAWFAAAADYAENGLVLTMLNSDTLSAARVTSASTATVLKSGMTTAATLLLLVALLAALWRSRFPARSERMG